MEIVLQLESKNAQKVKEILNKDQTTSRASITFRDGSLIGKEGQFCHISGTDEQCKKAIELTKEVAKETEKKVRDEFITKLKEEESKAGEGLGGIFG